MELTPEILANAAVGLLVIVGAVGVYLRGRRLPAKVDPILAGVGLGYVEKEQMERLIAEVKRIADAITDKNTADINDKLEHLAERLDQIGPKRR